MVARDLEHLCAEKILWIISVGRVLDDGSDKLVNSLHLKRRAKETGEDFSPLDRAGDRLNG